MAIYICDNLVNKASSNHINKVSLKQKYIYIVKKISFLSSKNLLNHCHIAKK